MTICKAEGKVKKLNKINDGMKQVFRIKTFPLGRRETCIAGICKI